MGQYYGTKIELSGLVLHVDPANSKCWDGSSSQIQDLSPSGFVLTKGSNTTSSTYLDSRTFSVSATSGTIDTGFRYGTTSDKVVDSAFSWTCMTWIRKSGAPNNWWHLFTDGVSGDILTVNQSGDLRTSMNSSTGGTWTSGSDFSYSTSWNSLSDGFHHLALVYDRANSRLQLYIDGISTGWNTGKIINPQYKLRNFHGWGSAQASYHSDGDHSVTSVYNKVLSDDQILKYFNTFKGRFGL